MNHFPPAPRGPSDRAAVSPTTGMESVAVRQSAPAPLRGDVDREPISPRTDPDPPTVEQIMVARQHFDQLLTAARDAARAGRHVEATRLLTPITDTYPTAHTHPRARTRELPQALELLADVQVGDYPSTATKSYGLAIEMWTTMARDLAAAGRPDDARTVRVQITRLQAKQEAARRTAAHRRAQVDRLVNQDQHRPGLGSIGRA